MVSRTRSGKRSMQPLGLDGAGDADERRLLVAAVLGFDGHEKRSAVDRAGGRELRRPAGGELQLGALAAARHAIGKCGEDGDAAAHPRRFPLLARRIDDAADLADGLGGARLPLRFHEDQQVGARGWSGRGGQPLAGAEERGDGAAVLGHAAAPRFDDQTAKPRMQRIARHLLAERAVGAELLAAVLRHARRRRRAARRAIPANRGGRCPMRAQEQRGRRQIGARDLGRVLRGAADEILERVEADRAAGPVRPARPARWLAEAWLMRPTCKVGRPDHGEWPAMRARPLSITAVDALDGDGAFRDVGGEDDLALRRTGRTARSCSSGDWSPCSGRSSQPRRGRARRRPSARGGSRRRRAGRRARGRRGRGDACRSSARGHLLFERRGGMRRVLDFERDTAGPRSAGRGQPPRYAAMGAASSVADITTRRRSGRGCAGGGAAARARGRLPGGARGIRRARRRRRAPACGSESSRRVRTPSVRKRRRVRGPATSSKRTW